MSASRKPGQYEHGSYTRSFPSPSSLPFVRFVRLSSFLSSRSLLLGPKTQFPTVEFFTILYPRWERDAASSEFEPGGKTWGKRCLVRGQLTLIWSAASSRLLRIDGPYSDRLKFQFSPCPCETWTTWSLQRTKKYIYKWDSKYSFVVECLSNSIKILKSTKENHAHILLNIYFV